MPAAIADEVDYAVHQGWITGVTTAEFRPDAPLTANAWAAFLLRMLGWSDKAGDFTVSDAAAFAQRVGLFSSAYSGALTQGDLFETAADVLSFPCRDGSGTVAQRLVSRGAVSRSAANALGLLESALTARQAADRCSAAVIRLDTYETEKYWEEGVVTGRGQRLLHHAGRSGGHQLPLHRGLRPGHRHPLHRGRLSCGIRGVL